MCRRHLVRSAEETMLRWGRQQRVFLAETLRDVTNIAAGALVFGQFLGDSAFSTALAVPGLGV
jgi:hypothetical protein